MVKNIAKALGEAAEEVDEDAEAEAGEADGEDEVEEAGGDGVTVAGGADPWDIGILHGPSTTIFTLVVFAMIDISTIFKLE